MLALPPFRGSTRKWSAHRLPCQALVGPAIIARRVSASFSNAGPQGSTSSRRHGILWSYSESPSDLSRRSPEFRRKILRYTATVRCVVTVQVNRAARS